MKLARARRSRGRAGWRQHIAGCRGTAERRRAREATVVAFLPAVRLPAGARGNRHSGVGHCTVCTCAEKERGFEVGFVVCGVWLRGRRVARRDAARSTASGEVEREAERVCGGRAATASRETDADRRRKRERETACAPSTRRDLPPADPTQHRQQREVARLVIGVARTRSAGAPVKALCRRQFARTCERESRFPEASEG